ncbi:hypothetical protein EDD15DRAFT_2198401 [Pisolithus albus]|nr:hypothetical protein EDD15DRAFT_2198401 [Pisolithus albus]
MVKAPRPHTLKQSLQLLAMSQAMTVLQEQMDTLTRRSEGKGYSIIRAMGLSKQKEYFNYLKCAIRKLASCKLDMAQTLMRQKDKLLVEKVIFQAQLEYKIFQQYENAWPVHDLLAQYLRNNSQQEKKAGMKFQHKNRKNKASITDDESSHSDFSTDVDGSDVNTSHSEMGSANEESDSSRRGCLEDVQSDPMDESDEDAPRPAKSKPTKTMGCSSGKIKSHHQMRHKDRSKERQVGSMDESDKDAPRPAKSKPMKTVATDDNKPTDEESDPAPGNVISGKICLGMDCEDVIPNVDSLSGQLRTALLTYADLVKANKPSACFKADLETDGYTMAQFSQLQHVPISSAVWHNSRIGYYSSKGTAIIMHYLSYFVVPHIGCQLIAEDLSISMTMNAYNLMDPGILDGQTIHDAAKALVSLQYSKTSNAAGADQSNPHTCPKPRIILRPPKQVGESSSLGHEVNEDQDVGRASVLMSTGHGSVPQASRPQVPLKKLHG